MRVLLIGGGGVVGTAIARHLRDNHDVTILDRRAAILDGAKTVQGDAADIGCLAELIRDSDAVVHIASLVPRGSESARVAGAADAARLNIGNVIQALMLSQGAQVVSFVHISSLSVFREFGQTQVARGAVPDAAAPYGLSKRLAESACEVLSDGSMTVTSLRLAFPARLSDWPLWRSPSAPAEESPRQLALADGTPFAALHPEDLAEAVERSLRRRGEYAAIAIATSSATIDDDTAQRLLDWAPRHVAPTGEGAHPLPAA